MSELQKISAEDWAIIARFKRGDKQAFDDLVRRHRKSANIFALRLTKNSDEAADLVSETFIRVYRAIYQFNGHSSFTTWLYRIEMNCFLDMRKREIARAAINADIGMCATDSDETTQIAFERENAQIIMERREQFSTINNAVKKLPDCQRRTFMMFLAELMTYEEIASGLALPVGTVKSRINRARARMAKTLLECQQM